MSESPTSRPEHAEQDLRFDPLPDTFVVHDATGMRKAVAQLVATASGLVATRLFYMNGEPIGTPEDLKRREGTGQTWVTSYLRRPYLGAGRFITEIHSSPEGICTSVVAPKTGSLAMITPERPWMYLKSRGTIRHGAVSRAYLNISRTGRDFGTYERSPMCLVNGAARL